jgi:hypothetical protein
LWIDVEGFECFSSSVTSWNLSLLCVEGGDTSYGHTNLPIMTLLYLLRIFI